MNSEPSEDQAPGTFWRRLAMAVGVAAFLAILCWPAPEGLSAPAQRLAAVSTLMAIWWMTQPIPIAATSLLPLALYPVLEIQTASEVSLAYGDQNVFLFLGGFLIAIAIERWNLHRRIALHIISRVGSSPRRIVIGFMLATAFLSMWISNTATALVMLPIGLALIVALGDALPADRRDEADAIAVPMLLGIAYASTCGGFATLVGTPTNISLRGFWEREFVSQGAPPIGFGDWMLMFVPVSLLMLIASAWVMTWRLKPFREGAELSKDFFRKRIEDLGRPSGAEWRVLAIFAATAFLWITRQPLIIGDRTILPDWPGLVMDVVGRLGWDISYLSKYVADSTIAMFMASLLFILPGDRNDTGDRPRLLGWEQAEARVPWGMLFLFGGGFAMADAFTSTGLSGWVGRNFAESLAGQSLFVMVAAVSSLLTLMTEFASNTATINTVMPILGPMATELGVDPRWLLIPATVAASCGFMLPVGTPPNAIVFSTGKVPISTMLRYGFILDVFGVIVVTLAMWFLAPIVMGLPR